MKKKKFSFSIPYVFVPMCVDYLHHGHIKILLKAKKYGKVIVGLMTDKGIKSYKGKKPIISFRNRKLILSNIKMVNHIIPINGLEYSKLAKKFKFDFFIHGDDWKNGSQSAERKTLINTMKLWNGKVIEPSYTKGISSNLIKKKLI